MDMKRSVELGMVPKNPTRQFEVNARVILGHHEEVYVREIGEVDSIMCVKQLELKEIQMMLAIMSSMSFPG